MKNKFVLFELYMFLGHSSMIRAVYILCRQLYQKYIWLGGKWLCHKPLNVGVSYATCCQLSMLKSELS